MPLLTSKASQFCKASFSKYLANVQISATASDLAKDLNTITLLSPTSFSSYSSEDAMKVASALTNSSKTISKTMAAAIGNLIPMNASAVAYLTIASALPIECFTASDPLELAKNAAKIDAKNMPASKKAMIALSVIDNLLFFLY